MKISFALMTSNQIKCLDTCIYYKNCYERLDILNRTRRPDWFDDIVYSCPMVGSIIEPKFEKIVISECGDICPSMTHYHCHNCSVSMPIDKCDMMIDNHPSKECPMHGMPSGEYELELKKENFVLVSKIGKDCPNCKKFVDGKCELYDYDLREHYCEKLEKINEND